MIRNVILALAFTAGSIQAACTDDCSENVPNSMFTDHSTSMICGSSDSPGFTCLDDCAGSAEPGDWPSSTGPFFKYSCTCGFEIFQTNGNLDMANIIPSNICSTLNTACWTEAGNYYDALGGGCTNDGVAVSCVEALTMMCEGWCVSSTSTVSALQANGKTFKDVPITSLKVGDKVESRDKDHKRVSATVMELPHSTASTDFIHISMENTWGNQPSKHQVRATPHHTFPMCTSELKQAHELKSGDCLIVAGGAKATVAAAKRVPSKVGEMTYSVVLEEGHDVIVAGGILTHAASKHVHLPEHTDSA